MNTPKPFCLNKKTFKAFVLGADPTNFNDEGKPKQLEYAFGIMSDEPRYFNGLLKNLNYLGLHLEDVYVQNVIQYYLPDETSKLNNWEQYADKELPKLRSEFDLVDSRGVKPVLVTAERILKFLLNPGYKLPNAESIYSAEGNTIFKVNSEDNKLGRPLFAFYRHYNYGLDKHDMYASLLNSIIHKR